MVFRGHTASVSPEKVWIYLYSCNAVGIKADVVLTLVNQREKQPDRIYEGEDFLPFRAACYLSF